MFHFKDLGDGYYCVSDLSIRVPEGSMQITEDEAATLVVRASTPLLVQAASPRQIRQALTRAGLRQAVEGAIAAGDQDTKDWWEFATRLERLHPRVIAMGAALRKTEAQMDELWALAVSL